MTAFHDVLFPLAIALGSRGGPQRRTEIVTLGSGAEERNARWRHSRRRYNAGYGVKSLRQLAEVVAFFEERRGRLYGFRWHDRLDHMSCRPGDVPAASDQLIGVGDGETRTFQLRKLYGAEHDPYDRPITKPVAGSVAVAVDGFAAEVSVDHATGRVTLAEAPVAGVPVTAGYRFDVPVRFDTDALDADLSGFEAGAIPDIPLMEIRA